SRQPWGAAEPRNEAEFDFRQPHHGTGGRHPNVAGQGQFESPANAGAVDGDENRLLRSLDATEQQLSTKGKLRSAMHGREVRQLMQIRPRAEKPSGTGHDDYSDILILLHLIQNLLQILEHGEI